MAVQLLEVLDLHSLGACLLQQRDVLGRVALVHVRLRLLLLLEELLCEMCEEVGAGRLASLRGRSRTGRSP